MSYSLGAFGAGCAPQPCPGREVWDASICACNCPPGTVSGALVGDCVPIGGGGGVSRAGIGTSELLVLAGIGAVGYLGFKMLGRRR